MINKIKKLCVVVSGLMVASVSVIAMAQTVTVNPYSDEYVILAGTAYDESGKLFYLPSNKNGTFGNTSYIGDLGWRAGAGIADFDNDGDLDFVAGAIMDGSNKAWFYLFENKGNGNFEQHLIATGIPAGEKVGTFAVGDFNGDGFKDFVAPIYGSHFIYLFINKGDKTFMPPVILSPLSNPVEAKEGDFNEDGYMDFVITEYYSAMVYLYEGDGAGGFTVKPLFEVVNNYCASDITVGDFNRDGHLDIIVDDFVIGGGGGHLYVGDGNGNFTFLSTVYSRTVNVPYSTYGVDSYDFNGDGKLDLILSTYEFNPTGLVFIMEGNGDGTFQSPYQVADVFGSVFPVTPSERPVIKVAIDIKPGSFPNSINLKSQGVVPVAVLTEDGFDASTIDPATVLFAGASPLRWAMEDVDSDGDIDILFHFDTQALKLTGESIEATLTGKTKNGIDIQGTDMVNIVPEGKGEKN